MTTDTDINGKPFETLTPEEIDELRKREQSEAPNTAQDDGAWNYNQSFTGVRVTYTNREDYIQSLSDRANTLAEDYEELRKEALHYIAKQTLFDFDDMVEPYVISIVRELGLAGYKRKKELCTKDLAKMIYPIARRMIPDKLLKIYQMYPEAFQPMEGFCLHYEYENYKGIKYEHNAWIELDLPDYVNASDMHDELKARTTDNPIFGHILERNIRRVHYASVRYRKKIVHMAIKCGELSKSNYGGFANVYPVTFYNVCKYIEQFRLDQMAEANAESNGTIARSGISRYNYMSASDYLKLQEKAASHKLPDQ